MKAFLKKKNFGSVALLLCGVVVSMALVLVGCDEDSSDGTSDEYPPAVTPFECTADREGWEQCSDGRIQWCHVTENSHFHWGQNCEDQGYDCYQAEGYRAFCVEPEGTCDGSEGGSCIDNNALNCIDGRVAVTPCGTAECEVEDGVASCHGHHDDDHHDDDHHDDDHHDDDHE